MWPFTCSKLCLALRMMHMDTVASCISMKPEDNNALTAWRLVNWVRCLGEDLPQCFFQSLVSMVDARWWKTLLDSVLPLLQFSKWDESQSYWNSDQLRLDDQSALEKLVTFWELLTDYILSLSLTRVWKHRIQGLCLSSQWRRMPSCWSLPKAQTCPNWCRIS